MVEITTMERYHHGVPVSGGLYDAALGPCDFGKRCKTCGNGCAGAKGANDCPGHFGHIQVSGRSCHLLCVFACVYLLVA